MKVLYLLNSCSYSGAENVVIEIIRTLEKVGVKSLYVSRSGPIEKILIQKHIPYCLVEKLSVRSVKIILENFEPDIIHAHDFTASIIASFFGRKIFIISHLHNNPIWIKKINYKTIVYACSIFHYKKILMVSEAVEKEFVFHNMIRKKGEVIGNPISLKEIVEKAGESNEKKFDIIFLGRLTEQKDPIRFIKLIQELVGEYPEIQCAMIGEGELREKCIDILKEKNLQKNINLFGFQENPYPILKKSKMLCMPSRWEGFGLAAVEALALGVPVLCTPVGGLVKIVDDLCGKLCEKDSDFLKEMKKLLSDETYIRRKSLNALEKAKKLENIKSYTTR